MLRRIGNRAGLWAALVLALPLLGGCASTANGEGGGAGAAVIEVENNLIPPTALTIYMVPESGVRRLIGNVGPSQTRVLTIDSPLPGQHRFMGRTTAGQEIVSNGIAFGAADTLRWDLNSNIVTVGDD